MTSTIAKKDNPSPPSPICSSEQIVTDNSPQFIAEEFAAFMKRNSVQHICTIQYHPALNGLAERFVQSSSDPGQNDGHLLEQPTIYVSIDLQKCVSCHNWSTSMHLISAEKTLHKN